MFERAGAREGGAGKNAAAGSARGNALRITTEQKEPRLWAPSRFYAAVVVPRMGRW